MNLLGYRITNGQLQPDPEHVKPLMELPNPVTAKALQRIIGMFAYYAQWIPRYSKKVKPLLDVKRFPLCDEAVSALELLKKCLSTVTLGTIDESLPFTVETDAPEPVILNRQNRPVAFSQRHWITVKFDIQV